MTYGGLPVPTRLQALIDSGLWPPKSAAIPPLRIRRFAPDEQEVVFYKPPFYTVERQIRWEISDKFKYWEPYGALDQIDPGRALVIGDFGLGTDSVIILDYRAEPANPAALRLRWHAGYETPRPTNWIPCARNFEVFADMLGLDGRSIDHAYPRPRVSCDDFLPLP